MTEHLASILTTCIVCIRPIRLARVNLTSPMGVTDFGPINHPKFYNYFTIVQLVQLMCKAGISLCRLPTESMTIWPCSSLGGFLFMGQTVTNRAAIL